jgi:hypothetical protein
MRKYGVWAGSPGGTPENPDKCVASIHPEARWIPRQCAAGGYVHIPENHPVRPVL